MKKLGFFSKLLYWLNTIVALLLLISFILPFIPPVTFPTISLVSLCVFPLILVNCLFFVYWLIRFKKQFWLSFIMVLIAYFHFSSFFFIKSSEGDTSSYKNTLKVLSFNVRLFNLYENTSTKDSFKDFINIIDSQNPDVILVQEYMANEAITLEAYPYQYVHFKKRKRKKGITSSRLGHAIFSKYPLINNGAFDFKGTTNNTLFADVIKENDTIRLYNLHLSSMGIIASVESLQKGDKDRLMNRIKRAFVQQQQQVDLILKHRKATNNKVIIAGDFNNTAFSYIYRKLQNGMKDSYAERGAGLGTTFSFDGYPLRIDYILADESFEIINFKTEKSNYSDHYSIMTTLAW